VLECETNVLSAVTVIADLISKASLTILHIQYKARSILTYIQYFGSMASVLLCYMQKITSY